MAVTKIVALTQEHRGHGVSTAAYFLGQALAQCQLPVLLGDLTNRHARLPLLNKHFPTRNLVLWTPPNSAMRDVGGLLKRARDEVAGRACCLLVDCDLTTLEALNAVDGEGRLLDYLLLAADPTPDGEKAVGRLAERFITLREHNRIGVAYARIPTEAVADLPEQTNDELPILGYWPADYRLAAVDDFAAAGTPFPEPHQPYQDAMARLATRLARLVPLTKPA